MNREPSIVRVLPAATQAASDQADYYAKVSGNHLAERWLRAVDQAFVELLNSPEGGSQCNFAHPALADLRRWPVPGFPNHLLFYKYLRESDTLVIADVIHGARNLPVRLLSRSPSGFL